MGFAAISGLRLRGARDTQGQVSTWASHDVWGNGTRETEGQTGEKPAHKAPLTQQLRRMSVKAAPPRNGEEKRGDPSICNQLPIAIFPPPVAVRRRAPPFCFALLLLLLSPPPLDWESSLGFASGAFSFPVLLFAQINVSSGISAGVVG